MKGYYPKGGDRFASIEKRTFRSALIHLLETEYKLIGSHRVLEVLADDIEQLQNEYFPGKDRLSVGTIAWVTTKKTVKKPGFRKKTEDYENIVVFLPLITQSDLDKRISIKAGTRNSNFMLNRDRELNTLTRLVKSAWEQGGMLSQAELCVLMNRSLATMRRYIAEFEANYPEETLPLKGYILDQGSRPTHKAIILNLYEQGIDPTEIASRTCHGLDAVDRYIKAYERVKGLNRKGLDPSEIKKATGLSIKVVNAYLTIVKHFHSTTNINQIPLA
jgi:hypothetical protein